MSSRPKDIGSAKLVRAHMADRALTAAAFALVLAIVCGIGVERRLGTEFGGEHTAMLAQATR